VDYETKKNKTNECQESDTTGYLQGYEQVIHILTHRKNEVDKRFNRLIQRIYTDIVIIITTFINNYSNY